MRKIVVYKESASEELSFTRSGDSYEIGKKNTAFAIGDSPIRMLTKKIRKYPQEDFGQEASKIFCKSTTEYLEKSEKVTEVVMKEALIYANNNIRKFNEKIGKPYNDPLNYDMAETVGVTVYLSDNKLIYGLLEDCYYNIFDKDTFESKEKLNFTIVNSSKFFHRMTKSGQIINYIPKELQNIIPKETWWEPCWCNYQRNKPDFKDENGKNVGWGCFNGEKEAEQFFQIGSVDINKGDHIFLFSDGMIPLIENKDFVKWFINNCDDSFGFGLKTNRKVTEIMGNSNERNKEKTLIYIQY